MTFTSRHQDFRNPTMVSTRRKGPTSPFKEMASKLATKANVKAKGTKGTPPGKSKPANKKPLAETPKSVVKRAAKGKRFNIVPKAVFGGFDYHSYTRTVLNALIEYVASNMCEGIEIRKEGDDTSSFNGRIAKFPLLKRGIRNLRSPAIGWLKKSLDSEENAICSAENKYEENESECQRGTGGLSHWPWLRGL